MVLILKSRFFGANFEFTEVKPGVPSYYFYICEELNSKT